MGSKPFNYMEISFLKKSNNPIRVLINLCKFYGPWVHHVLYGISCNAKSCHKRFLLNIIFVKMLYIICHQCFVVNRYLHRHVYGLVNGCNIFSVLMRDTAVFHNAIDLSNKSHKAPAPFPMMHQFVAEMCTFVHILLQSDGLCDICVMHCEMCEMDDLGSPYYKPYFSHCFSGLNLTTVLQISELNIISFASWSRNPLKLFCVNLVKIDM